MTDPPEPPRPQGGCGKRRRAGLGTSHCATAQCATPGEEATGGHTRRVCNRAQMQNTAPRDGGRAAPRKRGGEKNRQLPGSGGQPDTAAGPTHRPKPVCGRCVVCTVVTRGERAAGARLWRGGEARSARGRGAPPVYLFTHHFRGSHSRARRSSAARARSARRAARSAAGGVFI